MKQTKGHGLKAYMNHGRWLYHCPRCNVALPVEKNICPVCYPGALAFMVRRFKAEDYRKVPDQEMREQAQALAKKRGDLLEAVLPKEKARIEAILRPRKLEHMNWEPGESLDFLMQENRAHGVEVPHGI